MNDAIKAAQLARDAARRYARVMEARASDARIAARDAWDAVDRATDALDDAMDAALAAEQAKEAANVHP